MFRLTVNWKSGDSMEFIGPKINCMTRINDAMDYAHVVTSITIEPLKEDESLDILRNRLG